MESNKIPYFACKVLQGENSIYVPIPYGALENMCRALLANNEGTFVQVCGIGMLEL